MFALAGCEAKYGREKDPHVYLSFELLEDDTYMVKGFKSDFIKNVTIPSEHKGKKVTTIGDSAFRQGDSFFGIPARHLPIEKLVIEEGITHIQSDAFYRNGLTEVTLPDSLLFIGERAFMENNVSLTLPNNLTYIGEYAFAYTNIVGTLTLKNIVYGTGVFSHTNISKVILEEGIITIPGDMFRRTPKLEEVILPTTLEQIDNNAFESTPSLKNILFPDGLKVIGSSAFSHSGLETLIFNHQITIESRAFQESLNLESIDFNHKEIVIEDEAFRDTSSLENVRFNDLTTINPKAFIGAPLTNMYISDNNDQYELLDGQLVEKLAIEKTLVLGNNQLNDFTKFEVIGLYALAGRRFDRLNITPNVKIISPYAFMNSKINHIKIEAKLIESYAFYYTSIIETLEISSEIIKNNSFYYVRDYETLRLLNGIEEISQGAFVSNLSLKEAYIPYYIKPDELNWFIACHALKDIYYY